jgi:hypothetical protein
MISCSMRLYFIFADDDRDDRAIHHAPHRVAALARSV